MELCISRDTVDDLMRDVIELILSDGLKIETTKKVSTELTGILLELKNPLARLSRTETRGKLFSPLGELCWYLAGTKKLDFIQYYIDKYVDSAEDDEIPGAYGPRLFKWNGINQIANVTSRLRRKPTTRRATVQLFSAADLVHKEVPCTCTFQFLLRDQRLHMIVYMRSNDAYMGLPHDIFCFTMIQELIARELSVELGTYKHVVGSLHLYESNSSAAQQFLDEGFQSTTVFMPRMPDGDPWPAVSDLLEAERMVRTVKSLNEIDLSKLDPYWADLVRLLLVFRANRERHVERMEEIRRSMHSSYFHTFIDMKIDQLKFAPKYK